MRFLYLIALAACLLVAAGCRSAPRAASSADPLPADISGSYVAANSSFLRTLSLRDDGTYVEELNMHERLRDDDPEGIGGKDARLYGKWSRRGRVVTFHCDDGTSGDAVLTIDGLRLPYASYARVR